MNETVQIPIPVGRPTIQEPGGDPGGCDNFADTLFTAGSRYEDFAEEATQLDRKSVV